MGPWVQGGAWVGSPMNPYEPMDLWTHEPSLIPLS